MSDHVRWQQVVYPQPGVRVVELRAALGGAMWVERWTLTELLLRGLAQSSDGFDNGLVPWISAACDELAATGSLSSYYRIEIGVHP